MVVYIVFDSEPYIIFFWHNGIYGKTLVSTQMLVNNNADMIAEYSGSEVYKRSVKTYGGESSAFISDIGRCSDKAVPPFIIALN